MKYPFKVLLLLLFFAIFTGTAGAVEEIHQYHVQNLNVNAPDNLSISTLELQNIDPDSVTNITLNTYGETYLLNVVAQKKYYSLWEFDVNVIYPNMTTETKHVSNFAPLARSFNLKVDSFWFSVNNSIHETLGLNLYTTVRPLTVNTVYILDPTGVGAISTLLTEATTDIQALPFSQVGISSSSFFDATLYAVNEEELKEQQNKNILAATTNAVSTAAKALFAWSWDMLIKFVEAIPYLGPYLSAVLIISALTLDSIVFYSKLLLVDYAETSFLTFEFFILSYSICKKGSIWTKLKRVADCHLKAFEFVINASQAAVRLFTSIIEAVAAAINSIKP